MTQAEEAHGQGEAEAHSEANETQESAASAEEDARSTTKPAPEKMSNEERVAKMKLLRQKMADSSRANRKDLLSEQSKSKNAAKKDAKNSRKLAEAEKILEERDIQERGDDPERYRNFAYSVEDNERWEEKLEEKERRKDRGAIDFQDAAERSYRRQIKSLKPDLAAYNAQRDQLNGGSKVAGASTSSQALTRKGSGSRGQVVKQEDLYRDANTLSYGDHKPSEQAIDKLIGHLNVEQEQIRKRSRKREDDPDAEVNYINDKNKHFNKKIARYFDKYTKEIRENCEWFILPDLELLASVPTFSRLGSFSHDPYHFTVERGTA
ncbi:SYF2-domain-containing protein [Violaceomyces palustris]|uniref:SYF2-domain-containing protein n=1 Tax=Violaceomyces palustris TaxID=1673888 RepID=A0ACD0NYP0_9BASI|nr:SYF2-domain-containing protein [Violaceomyces palustris]